MLTSMQFMQFIRLVNWKRDSISCVAALALFVGCGDDREAEAGEAGEADEAAATETGDGAPGDGEGDGDGDGEPGDGDPGDGEPGDGEPGDGDPGDGDPEPTSLCDGLGDAEECAAAPECQAVNGNKLKSNGPDSPCLEPSEFLGCIPAQSCDDIESWFCKGDKQAWQLPDSCGAADLELCDGPAGAVELCP